MSTRPWFKMYPSDFISGCMRLDVEQKGALAIVLFMIYDEGDAIENDAQWIARVCGCSVRKWKQLLSVLIEKGKLILQPDGRIHSNRAKVQLEKEDSEARKFAENGAKGGQKKAENKRVSNENSDLDQKELMGKSTIPSPSPVPEDKIQIQDSIPSHQPAESVPAAERKQRRLNMLSPAHEWVALASAFNPKGPRTKDQHTMREDIYVGPPGPRRPFYASARKIAQAARQPESWGGDWDILARWMTDGFYVETDIIPLIEEFASRPGYPSGGKLGSLSYFSKALYQRRKVKEQEAVSLSEIAKLTQPRYEHTA